jgi:hypothetical protein
VAAAGEALGRRVGGVDLDRVGEVAQRDLAFIQHVDEVEGYRGRCDRAGPRCAGLFGRPPWRTRGGAIPLATRLP